MASLCRNVAVLLFFVSPLMHSHLFAHASTSSPPITRKRITFLTGLGSETDDIDYDDYSSPPEMVPSVKIPRLYSDFVCQYDPCLENQEPCDHLKAKTGCLCPGRSGGDKPPHAPRIQALLPITEGENTGKIEVQWCAPQSVVSSYKVIVEGSDNAMEFGDAFRRGFVGSLEVGTKVCVEAVNNAGHSSPSDFSCKRFERPESSDHKLMAGVIGGGVAFILLLVIVAVVLCRRQMCQKARRESVIGLGNPSYKAERAS
ncbi:hypothetical protein XENORESO_011685 [Xenotaenia resolanae]|uniref:LRRN4 C-terminal-like protein n=1 Tax=Xenotaenia resolanae TaxID=208358 RepID=A0ABV0X4C0_9TELE